MVDATTQSFLSPAWYEKQFRDMLAAGIDFVLPDYWGEPGQHNRRVAPAPDRNLFATQGIPPMVTALQWLDQAGTPLKIGQFFDTSILNNEDLTSERGKQIFYATIRDYFSRIPPRYWAAIDNRPVVWLYDAQKVSAFDQSTLDYVYDHFAQDFGGLRPWIVRVVHGQKHGHHRSLTYRRPLQLGRRAVRLQSGHVVYGRRSGARLYQLRRARSECRRHAASRWRLLRGKPAPGDRLR